MAAITSTAGPVPTVPRSGRHTLASAGARVLAAFRHFCQGASWEPGRDWLTRVTDPGDRQEPR
jgi:hypothetical protein